MIPLKMFLQFAGGCPPFGLGLQSSCRIGSIRAQSSSLTSQIVSNGLGCERFRAMKEPPWVAHHFTQGVSPLQDRF
jgi:hypothetical protein